MTKSQVPFTHRAVSTLCAISIAFLPMTSAVHAGNHPLSAVAETQTLDYVVNVDWDFDSPPGQVANASQILDRAYVTNVLQVMARSIFTMTEGLHRVGTVYVYRNAMFGDNVDIRLLNTDGRSAANVGGWTKRNQTSFNHLAMSGQPETTEQLGKVIAHELGHYTYGMFDEYVEAGRPLNPNDPGSPSESDTPKNSIMNNHLQYLSFSTPADYSDSSGRQTAHYRTFAGSQWETLIRPAAQDPERAQGVGRTSFAAFANLNPQTMTLATPVSGFDAKLNVVFVPDPVFRETIVVDLTLPETRLNELIQGAKALVSQAKANTQVAILAYPSSADPLVLGFTVTSIEGKQALDAALSALKPVTSGIFDPNAAFAKAREITAAVRATGDPATIHLLTGNEAAIPIEAANALRTARIAVNPLAMTGGSAAGIRERKALMKQLSASSTVINLSQLASQTSGIYNVAKNGAEAAKDAVNAAKQANSDPYAVIHSDGSDSLAAGASYTSEFRLASGSTDGEVFVELYFDPADANKLSFTLVAPDGTAYPSNNLPTGIGFNSDAQEGVAEFSIAPSFGARSSSGVWKVRTTTTTATSDSIDVEVSATVRTKLVAEVIGGSAGAATGPVLKAILGGEKQIKGATVVATVIDENGKILLDEVAMKDDGVAPDVRAGDGLYTLDLSGKLPAGEYFAFVFATTSASSRTASLGALVKGAIEQELPVELLQRVAQVDFSLESGAKGVSSTNTSPVTSDGSSGGCTTDPNGRDGSLLLLLALAGAGWLTRRNPQRQD